MLTFEPPYTTKKVINKKVYFLVYWDQVKHKNYEFEVNFVKFEYHFKKIF